MENKKKLHFIRASFYCAIIVDEISFVILLKNGNGFHRCVSIYFCLLHAKTQMWKVFSIKKLLIFAESFQT